jgi:hypothetical protein
LHARARGEADTRDHRLLMDVEPRTPWIEDFPCDLLGVSARSPLGRSLESALSGHAPVDAVWGARGAPGLTDIRAQGTTEIADLWADTHRLLDAAGVSCVGVS